MRSEEKDFDKGQDWSRDAFNQILAQLEESESENEILRERIESLEHQNEQLQERIEGN